MPSAARPPTGRVEDAEDICPVCKSSRYLNPKMKFLINPECYHRMCESCVDRIFSTGPAPCPVAGCGRTLRKARFKKQTFQDVQIERECDIRKRLSTIFNHHQQDFETLRDFNDYEEWKEDITQRLIHNTDVAKTEAEIAAYQASNQVSIDQNAALDSQEKQSLEIQEVARKKQSALMRTAAIQEELEARKEEEAGRREIQDRIASSTGDAEEVARETQKVVLKKSTARRTAAEKARQEQQSDDLRKPQAREPSTIAGSSTSEVGFQLRGLKAAAPKAVEKPYDPFGGQEIRHEYYVPRDSYEHDWLDMARTDLTFTAGGYDVGEYCARAMMDGHAGLGIDIAEEMARRLTIATSALTLTG